ncbi:Putative multi-domain beta-ketoacyl polyketide synthase [Desulfonema limicola]|uniref:Multi-domain beta-ketoacyl polyketide synthase n=1 Tax=Desulfonema limicola TaxID=45656 RepID=A0A975B679_9BACT|nr:beta-ketoacyl synthase N-terminal-like domain-containing protein [Desulfonema limicola]QTA79536.1 Putative multi-domain beta-ketoacyl polyketide synthase [Desulfonema limicola]
MIKFKIPIAVVGIAGLFPSTPNLNIFWNNLINKKDSVIEVPGHRWVIPAHAVYNHVSMPDKAYSKRACLIDDDFGFEPAGFDIEESLIKELDPLYHMVLHTGRQAWQDCITKPIDKNKAGVVLAAIALPTDASSALTREILGKSFENQVLNVSGIQTSNLDLSINKALSFSAGVTSLPGAVLAKALGLGGGSFTLDAACASSIYAVKLACDELQSGRRDAMITGGVSRPECLFTQVGFTQLQALSPSGRCAPFDKSADGLVVGEGAGILILKRLDDALNHGDSIYGIIRGIGLSNDMRGNLLAPDTRGQVRAMEAAYQSSGWTPFDIDHIECHGAGTPVGDKTELTSLRTLWGETGWTLEQCAIGSVKSMTGHLLTAAGAAGMIKTLLGIKHKTLPPSLNFTQPRDNSPLINSPFRVQTQAQEWKQRNTRTPRRAAVSAFGFGGINAHLLFEEHPKNQKPAITAPRLPEKKDKCSIAIIGMGAAFGRLNTLQKFQKAIFSGTSIIDKRPPERWKGADKLTDKLTRGQGAWGAYIDKITLYAGEFQIPPNEIPDILPQQLLMLKVAAEAIKDAALPLKEYRPRMGTAIGIEFDHEASNFHLRWNLYNTVNHWKNILNITDKQADQWLEELRNQCGPPLTPSRVLGSLGAVTASRIAREFRLGGPSFTVSDESASGIRALQTAIRSLQQNETDIYLAGAVELTGDIRNIIINSALQPYTQKNTICPFDKKADGTIPGEGAAALILKRLDQAVHDQNKIYAVIKGTGSAGGQNLADTYKQSANQALKEAQLSSSDINYIETHGSSSPDEDNSETQALHELFKNNTNTPAISSLKPITGSTGASSGLASIVKTALCLYHKIIPALPNFTKPLNPLWNKNTFHIPQTPQTWTNTKNTPKKACTASITKYGNCSHTILQEFTKPAPETISLQIGGKPVVSTQIKTPETRKTPLSPYAELIAPAEENMKAAAKAHKTFLDFSNQLATNYKNTFIFQNKLIKHLINQEQNQETTPQPPAYSKEMCMEFATGSAAKVLGPEFAVIDQYKVRVRLPDKPLMLVDRIIKIEGKKGSLGSGRVITEHDVLPDAWYLDGNHAPVCISVEAGQADLFLCSYLGIDLAVKGRRSYRLLDAKISFHRELPRPGETIRYDIRIDKFVRQGETYMFFFRFEGTINTRPFITMRDGCAGFFTEQEVKNSGGIILNKTETRKTKNTKNPARFVPMHKETCNSRALNQLRQGNAAGCFGTPFQNIQIPPSQQLPGGQMKLIDRITNLDPHGGRFGLGIIQAQADIHPDDWFLTCHFIDDMVMPGTLMYECCAHTLRIYLQRMGWISHNQNSCFQPLTGIETILKCRGPVTPETRQVIYEIEIKETGYNPEPYVLADAVIYSDGHKIVRLKNMSMKLTKTSKKELETFWTQKQTPPAASSPLYNKKQLLAFCQGNPSEAFGEPYKIFDKQRTIARLPRPPYFFMDKITKTEPKPWILEPGGWIEAEYSITGSEWYFKADRSQTMPFCILLEIALQPCGWLAAYAGSALKSETDLKFRNLGGNAVLYKNLKPQPAVLTMRSRITRVSEAGGMIIENYDMEVLQAGELIYKGDTYFGFFSAQALASQLGIQGAKEKAWTPDPQKTPKTPPYTFPDHPPLTPDDKNQAPHHPLAMPAKALRMIDYIELSIPDGGPSGLGFIRGIKNIDINEWFFHAHFYQDPVCPGSLGIESFIQLIKYAALQHWPQLAQTHRFELETENEHNWIYRGQITQKNKQVQVEAVITQIKEHPVPLIRADGYLKVDGLFIYQMKNFGLKLIEKP